MVYFLREKSEMDLEIPKNFSLNLSGIVLSFVYGLGIYSSW